MSDAGFVGVLVIELHFPAAGSLKGKRKDLSSIKAILHGRFGASVAETDHQDLWQRSTVVATFTSSAAHVLDESLDAATRWLLERCPDGVRVERMVASLGDVRDVFTAHDAVGG